MSYRLQSNLEESLYTLNTSNIEATARSLIATPKIKGIVVKNNFGDEHFREGGTDIILQNTSFHFKVNIYNSKSSSKELLGSVELFSDHDVLLFDVFSELKLMAINYIFIFSALFLAFYILLTHMLTTPLEKLDSEIKEIDMINLRPIKFSSSHENEISHLKDTINYLIQNIFTSKQKVKAYQENLENLVHERTKDLHEANKKTQFALEAKTQFLANMSHEIRTPMNGVVGMINLIDESDLSKQNKSYLETLKTSSEQLMDVINNILDYSKIEAGKMGLEIIDFNLHQNLHETLNIFQASAKNKNISLELQINEEVPSYIASDPVRLKQIISNLISNAIKFTDKGKVKILVNMIDDKLNIEVHDTGIGMDPYAVNNLFQSFTQADSSITRKFGGTGLGLSISQALIQLLNGTITVKSELGKGSIFLINFPITLANTPQASDSDKQIENLFDQTPKMNILLVEDNLVNQKLSFNILKKLGHQVEIANDGLEAIIAVKEVKYDLVLMDIQMPNMDGITATRKIREEIHSDKLTIIALTANAFEQDKKACLDAGMNDFLSKPIKTSLLKEMLFKYCPKYLKKALKDKAS